MKLTTRTIKGMLIIVLCMAFALLAILLASFAQPEQTRETLAAWQPISKPGDAASQSPVIYTTANETAILTRSNETDIIIMGGAGGTAKEGPRYSYYSRRWNSDNQSWQLSGISTQGYEHIELSFMSKGSNTGPKNFTLEYSIDGFVWNPLKNNDDSWITYTVDADNKFHQHGSFPLTSAAGNLDQLHIRFFNADMESVNGETIKSAGTNYIADIIITGTPVE